MNTAPIFHSYISVNALIIPSSGEGYLRLEFAPLPQRYGPSASLLV